MLFVCGEDRLSAEPINVEADLIRVNDIENFDNAAIRFSLKGGGKCLFIAGHSTDITVNPIFEYRFENATVSYREGETIVAKFKDGSQKDYGKPGNASNADKAYQAMAGCRKEGFKPTCTPYTAAAHTKCIEAVQTHKIYDANPELIRKKETLLYIEGLSDALKQCYNEEKMLSEMPIFERMVK